MNGNMTREHAKISSPVTEVIVMKELFAKNPKQLDICLRLLHAEEIMFTVHVHETAKRKIYYGIAITVDTDKFIEIENKYRILTS